MSSFSLTIFRSISDLFLKKFIFKLPTINLLELFYLTQSKTLSLLIESLCSLDTIMLFTVSFFTITLRGFMKNVLVVVWATPKTVNEPLVFT